MEHEGNINNPSTGGYSPGQVTAHVHPALHQTLPSPSYFTQAEQAQHEKKLYSELFLLSPLVKVRYKTTLKTWC